MDSQRYRCRCYYLFTALFTQLKEELKQLREESKTDTVNEVTKAWAIVIGNAGQGARYKAFVARVAAQCGKVCVIFMISHLMLTAYGPVRATRGS